MRGRVLLLLLGSVVAAGLSFGKPMDKDQLTRSDICGECHRDIFDMWQRSAHAKAMEDPVFQDALRDTRSKEGEAVSRVCLGCHAPAVEFAKDAELEKKITWEGIGCDICHSLTAVRMEGPGPKLVFEPGPVKRGPIRDAVSTGHDVAYSELHTQSLACAGCHEFANSDGTAIMTTYSEWKGSESAKQGKTCQLCHMGRTKANVVDPKVKRVPGQEVNLHEMPGGHSLDQLHKALTVSFQPERKGDELLLDVRIANRGAGHAVPTGMPGRRVFLDLTVRSSDGRSFEERKVYGKSFADASGKTITRDSAYFAKGVKLETDSRLRPDEQRVERFRFPIPTSATAFVSVKLRYEHSPTGGPENRTSITFLSEDRTLPPSDAAKP